VSSPRIYAVAIGLFAVSLSLLVGAAESRDSQWREVRDAMNQGLPKTAIEKLGPIIQQAKADRAYAEAIKAIGLRITLEGNIQGNKPEEKIIRMRAEIAQSPAEMQGVMEAVLANWYWHYFQQNRWRFLQRTQTEAAPSDDFTTWDLARILQEIDRQFEKALADQALLKQIPIAQYNELIQGGNAPDAYRPTLYDALVYNALEFYAAGEQAGSREEDAFELKADGAIFSEVDTFLAWDLTADNGVSPLRKAAKLYQDLLRFHGADENREAWMDANLARLTFGNNYAVGEEKTARYQAALRRLESEYANHRISSRVMHELAKSVHEQGDYVAARQLALTGLNRFPDSVGGRRCFNLIQTIEAREMTVQTERVWNRLEPEFQVRYRNVSQVHFRLVPFDFEEFIQSGRWQPEQMNQAQQAALLSRAPAKSWSAELPATADYQARVEAVKPPESLTPGSYFLIASHRADFRETDNQVIFTEVWVSDLALVTRTQPAWGTIDGFVFDAITGEPVAGAQVRSWRHGNANQRIELPSLTTDRDGRFEISADSRRQIRVYVSHRGHALSSSDLISTHQVQEPRASEQTRFFTDRRLYRPGQIVQYKGICLAFDQQSDTYETIASRHVTVVFSDVNNQEIERQTHRTNDYGSFSGSFTAPRDRVTGPMTLRIDGTPPGQTRINVEEYKRPKFQVTLNPPVDAAKLNAPVVVTGKTTAYTGVDIADAKVQWRVVREVRYPPWWYWRSWWLPPRPESAQEIAHGTTRTDASGSFELEFLAAADASVAQESEPTFQFTLYADVTDSSGETRSSQRTIRIGYVALAASMSAKDWLTTDSAVQIEVRTTTLDAEGQGVTGRVKVYSLQQPSSVTRAPLASGPYFALEPGLAPEQVDMSNPNAWALAEVVAEQEFTTDAGGNTRLAFELEAGLYRAVLETQDRFGRPVSALLPLQVLDPESERFGEKIPNRFISQDTTVEPGETFTCLWGSGYESARAFVEIEHRGKVIRSYWTDPTKTQVIITQEVDESMRGGFTVRATMVRENRIYLNSQSVDVPWTNQQLEIQWERIVSKLQPGSREVWTALITGPDAQRRAAEMVATLYDASLDAYQAFRWPESIDVFRRDRSLVHAQFQNQRKSLQHLHYNWIIQQRDGTLTYRSFLPEIIQNVWGYHFPGLRRSRVLGGGMEGEAMAFSAAAPATDSLAVDEASMMANAATEKQAFPAEGIPPAVAPVPGLDQVSARKNLNETAFFFPHLVAGDDGTVKLQFTMPEALTEWKFMGFAHDEKLRSGFLESKVVTAKDLMVQPNPPRFVREADRLEFTIKVSNQSPTRQTGTVRLSFTEARSGETVNAKLGLVATDQTFALAAGESTSLSWQITIPDEIGYLNYKAVGSTGRLSDGEEGWLPVLSRRVLVTESMPLPIRGQQTKEFQFQKLLQSESSDTLSHQSLTVQMASNPSWYAVMALPYLMEYPHQCSEQVFSRLYANALARQLTQSDPRIEQIFRQWRGTPALDSPLEKNEELKSVILEETPWVRQANQESQARRNVAILFDQNRLDEETRRAVQQLSVMQLSDGLWPWFPGGRGNEYITLYITTGFGRMRHLGIEVDMTAAIRSLTRLDAWSSEIYSSIKDRDRNRLSPLIALYLYGRSFFMRDVPVAPEHQVAFEYWQQQARQHWLTVANRQSQAHLAIALKRLGDANTPRAIMDSIKERSLETEEMGMFWRDLEHSWWWYRAPIETQAMMIEAFDEVSGDVEAVEACKAWLLKQKQTQDWKTTKATADAVYSLLLRGSDLLGSDQLVEVALQGQVVEPLEVEAGTGFYQQRIATDRIQAGLGQVTVTKRDEGVAWGSVHWQYLEDISKITPHEETPLKLAKQLFIKKNTPAGPTLQQVAGPVSVGDELVVRIVLRTDRDMEYVHLKDHRASGTEPVNVLSRYRFQDGLAYYESTRDTASHFFIDYLPKGTYVFEYSTRIELRGEYQTGIANIQCMYAPEFNSHSESLPLVVQ